MLGVTIFLAVAFCAQPREMELLITNFDDGREPVLVGQQLPEGCQAELSAAEAHSGRHSAKLHYNYPGVEGIMFSGIGLSGGRITLAGEPTEFRVWVCGDGSGQSVRVRLFDRAAETFQWTLGKLDFTGWRQMSCRLDRIEGFWGGNADGKINYPLTFDSVLVDSDIEPLSGDVFFDDLSYITVAPPSAALAITAETGWFGNVVFSDEPWELKVTARNTCLTEPVTGKVVVVVTDARERLVARREATVQIEGGEAEVLSLQPSHAALGMLTVSVKVNDTEASRAYMAVLAPPHPIRLSDNPFFGVCLHFFRFCTLFGQWLHETEECFELIRRAGFECFRDEWSWAAAEPRRGEWVFHERLGQFIGAARQTGLHPLFLFSYSNPNYDGGQAPHTPDGWQGFARYAVELVKRYGDVCRDWEVYNEPNVGFLFWHGREPNPDEYFGLLKTTYEAVKQADPNCTVLGVCTSYTDLRYIERVLELGGAGYMDALSIHPYRAPGSPEATGFVDEMKRARDLMVRYGMEDKKLWLTEIGWPTHEDPYGVPEQTSANYLVRTFVLARGLPFIERVFWYDFQDDGPDPTYVEHRYGLVRWDTYQPKPALVAFWVMTRHLAGAEFVRQLLPTAPDDKRYAFLFRRGKEQVIVAWADGVTATAAFALGVDRARLQWGDAFEETRRTVGGMLTLELGDMPVFISGEFRHVGAARPALELSARPARPAPGDDVTVKAEIASPSVLRGSLLVRPVGWTALPKSIPVALKPGQKATFYVRLRAPTLEKVGGYPVQALLRSSDGTLLAEASTTVVVTPF
ncbi:MAG: hypothetical protein N2512_13830 [Armatimonadetes bacterium]|nr:hypothetical protein [Armatimonadota bacterium]